MAFTSFCGLLSLQVGASVLAAVFFTLASVILAANIFDYGSSDEEAPVSIILVIILVVGFLLAGIMTFFSSYNESRCLAITSIAIIIILLLYWLILCIFSFISNPDHVKKICVFKRCPESFWIANLDYRNEDNSSKNSSSSNSTSDSKTTAKPKQRRFVDNVQDDDNENANFMSIFNLFSERDFYKNITKNSNNWTSTATDSPERIRPTKTKYAQFKQDWPIKSTISKNVTLNRNNYYPQNSISNESNKHTIFYFLKTNSTNSTDSKGKDDAESPYKYGGPFLGAIALFVINFIFLVFSAISMWSWSQELDYADYFVEETVYY